MCFQSTLSLGFLSFCWHQKWQNYCDKTCSQFEWHMGNITLVMATYLFEIHFEFFWQKDSMLLTKLVFYNHFYWAIYKKRSEIRISPKIILNAKKRPLKVTSTTFLLREIEKLGVISCYLISLHEKTSHGMTAFWQWTSEPVSTFVRNLYKVQSLCHHSTQHSGSLYQLIWLLL